MPSHSPGPLLAMAIVLAVWAPMTSAQLAAAQPEPARPTPPQAAAAQPAANSAPTTAPADKPPLKKEELEQLMAPIALYPDSLLTQMLMASTYPLEIVQADRWAKAHKDLKGDALAKELEKLEW